MSKYVTSGSSYCASPRLSPAARSASPGGARHRVRWISSRSAKSRSKRWRPLPPRSIQNPLSRAADEASKKAAGAGRLSPKFQTASRDEALLFRRAGCCFARFAALSFLLRFKVLAGFLVDDLHRQPDLAALVETKQLD